MKWEDVATLHHHVLARATTADGQSDWGHDEHSVEPKSGIGGGGSGRSTPSRETVRRMLEEELAGTLNKVMGELTDLPKEEGTHASELGLKGKALIDKRVNVRFGNGEFYGGRVAAFDSASGQHLVEYQDGQESWHHFPSTDHRVVP
jgi:hypothetical protein